MVRGDNIKTCQTKSSSQPTHDWVVYRLSVILGSVGHYVHKIIPGVRNELGDIEIKDQNTSLQEVER